MSLLTNATQANPNSFYFVQAGSGGSGGTLQSPASIIPDGTGNVSLSANASMPGGSSAISAIGGDSNIGTITVGGYGTSYRMGVLANGEAMPSLPNLQIGLNDAVPPCIAYDGGTHTLELGDANASGVVQTNCALIVGDNGAGVNQIRIQPISGTTTSIQQTVASGGLIEFGSSEACSNNIAIIDSGANSAVTLIGGNSGNSIQLRGGVGSGAPIIVANVTDGGALSLGSSTSVPDAILMTDATGADSGRTVIKNLVPPNPLGTLIFSLTNGGSPVTAGTIPGGSNTLSFANPADAVDGVYWLAVNCSTSPNLNVNTMAYYSSGTATWRTGGSAYGLIYGSGNLSFIGGGGNMILYNSVGSTVNGNVYWVRIFTGTIGI